MRPPPQADLAPRRYSGALSGPLASLACATRDRAIQALFELPDQIRLVSLLELVPVFGKRGYRHDFDILGMEVLAADRLPGG